MGSDQRTSYSALSDVRVLLRNRGRCEYNRDNYGGLKAVSEGCIRFWVATPQPSLVPFASKTDR